MGVPTEAGPLPPWRCQLCGAPIGYIGRFFQRMFGCRWLYDCEPETPSDERDGRVGRSPEHANTPQKVNQ